MGDEGGILCSLDVEGTEPGSSIHISITHLVLERKLPLFRQIDAYRRHRIKKLRQRDQAGFW